MNFTKMQGTGNDFILIDALHQKIDNLDWPTLSKTWCNRHFGIGADGLILVLPSKTADLQMRIFNADGTEAEMCGNGIRCFAFFAWQQKLFAQKRILVETLAGTMVPEFNELSDHHALVTVDMGTPLSNESILNLPIQVGTQTYSITAIGMGNPHAVVFVDKTSGFPVSTIGPIIENHELFPNRTNVEFVEVLSPDEINMRVWERGAGETLACGTGACAAAVAGILHQKLHDKVAIHLLGGDLQVAWKDHNRIFMTGPAEIVFEGKINL
jgi:diaminopimelate epimerase